LRDHFAAEERKGEREGMEGKRKGRKGKQREKVIVTDKLEREYKAVASIRCKYGGKGQLYVVVGLNTNY